VPQVLFLPILYFLPVEQLVNYYQYFRTIYDRGVKYEKRNASDID